VGTYTQMQVSTYMSTSSNSPRPAGARERLIQAAMAVFAREGLHKATTRAIAEEAGVSEVTLFRHFKSKDGLLAAVIANSFKGHAEEGLDETKWEGGLKKGLLHFATTVYSSMLRDEAFIRTMIGEADRQPEHAEKMIDDVVRPVRERFIANLEKARKEGKVRKGLDLELAAETFISMLLGGMLKNSCNCREAQYEPAQYVGMCVDLFVNGIAPASKS
jgi:AcrR family transcriptional regulator